jgi:hypothetical protein
VARTVVAIFRTPRSEPLRPEKIDTQKSRAIEKRSPQRGVVFERLFHRPPGRGVGLVAY